MGADLVNAVEAWKTGDEDGGKQVSKLRVFSGELVAGIDYDTVTATYPELKIEVYVYSLAGDTVRTVTVTYLENNKKNIATVVFS